MPVTTELPVFLKGKRIAVAPYSRTPNNMLRYILSRMHLDPRNDVVLVEVETNIVPTTVGAKQADVGASQEPFISIGYKRGFWSQPVYSAAQDLGPYTDTALTVRLESVEKEAALVKSMVRAVTRGLVYANTHRDEMVALARVEYPNASPEDLDASLKRAFADNIFSADGFIPPEAWATGEAVVRQGGILKEHVPYEDVIDMRFVNEVRKELNIN
jgi:NitT/TauT family transport system substrate-binding protein